MNELSEERLGRITASRAYDVMSKGNGNQLFGQMALTYANELAMGRLGVIPEQIQTFAMQWGIEHEQDAIDIYKDSRGVIVYYSGFVKHPDHDFIGCTPDGTIVCDEGGLLEVKAPQAKAHFEYLRKGIPPKYYAQVQFQMMVTGAKWCDFMTFNPTFPDQLKAKVFRIEADADYQADLLDRCIQLDGLVSKIVEEVQS